MGEKVTFKRPDGKDCNGYYAAPAAGARAPGMVVIQEWWGLNDQIKGVADRLAAAGYRALVPDLYRGKVTLDAAEANHLMTGLDFKDAATQDVRGAAQYLKQESGKVGVIGFCMGGALTVLAAMHVPEIDAASSWYGVPPPEAGDPTKIRIPVQGHFALQDAFFTPASVDALEAKLKQGNVTHEFHRYDANHAFGNETGQHYDAAATKLAWQRSLDFLAKHLR
ncbi:MAG: dienelactone hydrolase family protein [Burkholderiales bacterium]|nr:dienelactone hydrolase family protein [Burkholderiales bacterium]